MDEHTKALAVIERGESKAMSPVVAASLAILRENPNAETLRELLKVQQDYEANEARKAYAAALVALKRDMPTVIGRDKTVDFTSQRGRTHYTHASLAGAMEAVTGPLTQHGFSLSWHPSTEGNQVAVTCRLTHGAGHFEEIRIAAPIDNSGNKSPAQGVASTITLLQRYTALALLGIATADMKEPAGDAQRDPKRIDSARNLRAVSALKKYGKTREEAEAFLMRTVAEWTAEDIERLKEWAKPAGGEAA
jgi:hypothetical protein